VTAARARKSGCGRTLGLLAGLVVLFALAAGALWFLRVRPMEPPRATLVERADAPATPVPSPTAARAPTARPPASVPADFEPAGGQGRGAIAVVIDDVGNEDGSLERLARLDGPLAIAACPRAESREASRWRGGRAGTSSSTSRWCEPASPIRSRSPTTTR
jgi:hypothetical protein